MITVHFENGESVKMNTCAQDFVDGTNRIKATWFNFLNCDGVTVNLQKITYVEETAEAEEVGS